ncbi:hypothetical protein JW979_11095 [bacterium]|nr:hypothetical protein [candidate division CSSED10-310 bacterium]
MKSDILEMLIKQANWQRSRAGKSWIEKLRESARMRESIHLLRKQSDIKRNETKRQNP